jgi:hypothetical protein
LLVLGLSCNGRATRLKDLEDLMKKRMKQHDANLTVYNVPLNRAGARIEMFAKDKEYLGRLDFNFAGVDYYKPKARIPTVRTNWERLIKKLTS